jgi:hypothetical protein
MRVRVACNGHHRLFKPIRPIALTLCDIASLARQNKLLAGILAAIVVLLLFGAHLTAANLESHTFDLVYSVIKSYLSKKATGVFYQGILHWLLSNGALYIFRICAFLVLYASYELGRDVVFALSLLIAIALIAALAVGHYYVDGSGAWSGHVAGWTLLLAAFLGWFRSRYMSGRNDDHRSFDFDIGAALVRLRPF